MEGQARDVTVGARLVVFNLCSLEHTGAPAEVPQRLAGEVGLEPTVPVCLGLGVSIWKQG